MEPKYFKAGVALAAAREEGQTAIPNLMWVILKIGLFLAVTSPKIDVGLLDKRPIFKE